MAKHTILDHIQSQEQLKAYGTSEGVKKAWDSRNRRPFLDTAQEVGQHLQNHSVQDAALYKRNGSQEERNTLWQDHKSKIADTLKKSGWSPKDFDKEMKSRKQSVGSRARTTKMERLFPEGLK